MSKDRTLVFSVVERIQLINILGDVKGSLMRMQLINELVKLVNFSVEDHESLGLQTLEGQTSWNLDKVEEFEITVLLSPSLYGALRGRFEELDREGAIDLSILPLTEKVFDAQSVSVTVDPGSTGTEE